MNLSLFEVKVLLVVILCIPIVLLGAKLISSLTGAVLAGKKKSLKARKERRDGER